MPSRAARIAIVDYGAGNLASIERALRHAAPGLEIERAAEPALLGRADAVILPGVGAFEAAARRLRESGLADAIHRYLAGGRPLLGICLGYQLLFESSEESGAGGAGGSPVEGLGYLGGRVRRFAPGVTVPHMGWNRLELTGAPCPLWPGGPPRDGPYVYFAHSYHPEATDRRLVTARSTVVGGGGEQALDAAAWRENAGGVQFHPEKSGEQGLAMLARFVRWATGCASPETGSEAS